MLKTGLCSISFPRLTPKELVGLVKKAGLDGIEWAGNVHVPPGELKSAVQVKKMSEEAGLTVSSYGSYWKVVDQAGKPNDFSPVLESALALETDTIRIWAGHKPSDAVSHTERELILEGIRRALHAAEGQGIRLALEFHANTLADSHVATREVLNRIQHPNLYTYWQPSYWLTDPVNRIAGLGRLADRVLNVHVFHWLFRPGAGSWAESTDRRPLAEGFDEWNEYLSVPLDPAHEHYALLEFVRDDTVSQFFEDAAVLKQWLSKKPMELIEA